MALVVGDHLLIEIILKLLAICNLLRLPNGIIRACSGV